MNHPKGIASVDFCCDYKFKKSKEEELLDLEIEYKRLLIEKLKNKNQ